MRLWPQGRSHQGLKRCLRWREVGGSESCFENCCQLFAVDGVWARGCI